MLTDIQRIIETRIKLNWPYTEVAWDGINYRPTRGTEFIRPIIAGNTAEMKAGTVTSGLFRSEGSLHLIIAVSIKEGTRRAFFLAGLAAELLMGYQEEGLTMFGASPLRIGEDREWYKVDLVIPYEYDDCLKDIGKNQINLNIQDTVQTVDQLDIVKQ